MEFENGLVNYEAFGAKGDGVTDDLPAICEAHNYANANRLGVRTEPGATYHLGSSSLTAVITTETDWNTSRFTIDDTEVEDHKAALFEVNSLLEPIELEIDTLTRDQRRLEALPEQDCFVLVENDNKNLYIRRGLNQNNGAPQHDCFILRRDGSIEADIDWEYEVITRIVAQPIDDATLYIRGGIFTTFANRADNSSGYNYWGRNILISRSNTEVDGITHYVVGETSVGCPYSGFISAQQCARITLRNCFASGHKIYQTIGAAGLPVSMGTYDYNANNVVGFHMIGCTMNHITDKTHWGVIGSNFCKDILLEDCHLSRMDTHMGVSGNYIVRRCELGWMGLNAIGRGKLLVEDSTLYGSTLVSFRRDYGSTWEGELEIRNSRWIPSAGDTCTPQMINVSNDGTHDFGYPCSMPREVKIDGLFVDDSNTPNDYEGMYFFTDHDDVQDGVKKVTLSKDRPFPYAPCEKITIKNLETASGKKPRTSPNTELNASVVIEEG